MCALLVQQIFYFFSMKLEGVNFRRFPNICVELLTANKFLLDNTDVVNDCWIGGGYCKYGQKKSHPKVAFL
jgi:hypothetical protein